jgi:hypothetical protein
MSLLPRLCRIAHERRRDLARFVGSRDRASMMFQPCFLAVETKERISAKSIAPCNDRKPPERDPNRADRDFLRCAPGSSHFLRATGKLALRVGEFAPRPRFKCGALVADRDRISVRQDGGLVSHCRPLRRFRCTCSCPQQCQGRASRRSPQVWWPAEGQPQQAWRRSAPDDHGRDH